MQVRLAPILDRASGPNSLADAMAAKVLKINDNFAIAFGFFLLYDLISAKEWNIFVW